ncbi:MAG: SlyX protein [Rhodobacterales bacterium]|nr:MAG: SlyX protein [Rhodobacterales bacterium]
MSQKEITQLQEQVAYLIKTVDDLSDVVARQEKDIELLNDRVRILMEREASREAEAGGSVVLSDQRPPHW